jgi:hypothetical protein
MYGYRIWQLWPSDPAWPPVITSVTPKPKRGHPFPDSRTTRRSFEAWETRNFVASCRKHPVHQPPEVACACGVYAYPDLLDALKLIGQYCEGTYYAFGLVSGFGGKYNDGMVVTHDACMRFAETDVVALVKLGSAYRQGWLQPLAAKLGVELLALEDAERLLRSGKRVTRKANRQPGTPYIEEIPVGKKGDVARSALVADRYGRLYLRNDREVKPAGIDQDGRLKVMRESGDHFHLQGFFPDTDLTAITLLPFDGEAELAMGQSRLAGRVVSVNFTDVDKGRKPIWVARSESGEALRLPSQHQKRFLDLMEPGERIEVSHQCVSFDADRSVWLSRELFCNPRAGLDDKDDRSTDATSEVARFFVTALESGQFALEIQLAGTFRPAWNEDLHGFYKDTEVASIAVNGRALPEARMPNEMIDAQGCLTVGESGLEAQL